MGWLHNWMWTKREDVINHLVKTTKDDGKYLDHASNGNELYILVRGVQANFIVCCKLQGNRCDGWGYKDMDESMHPYMYKCPERILSKSTCQAEGSVKWREECRKLRKENLEASRLLKSVKMYDKVQTKMFGVIEYLYNSGGAVCKNADGKVYRYARKYFVGAEIIG